MMDTIKFRGTAAAFAGYVINVAVRELVLEHRKEQKAPRKVIFSRLLRIKEIEEDEDEPVYIVIKKDKKRKGAGCWLPLWRLIKRIFGKKQYYLDED